jgi:hypothetical protein
VFLCRPCNVPRFYNRQEIVKIMVFHTQISFFTVISGNCRKIFRYISREDGRFLSLHMEYAEVYVPWSIIQGIQLYAPYHIIL